MRPRASVVVVHHRGRERLMSCLAGVVPQAREARGEVVVVDNGSREGAMAEAARRWPEVRIVAAGRNLGFAGGCRAGAEASGGERLAFFNDDAVPEEGWLASLVSAADAAPPDVAVIAGRLSDRTGGRNDFSDGFLVFDGHAFADAVGEDLARFPPGEPGEERLFASGGNMLVSREEFFGSGGFDDGYFAYLEDVDFGWRQWILGRRILYEPRAAARHEGGATGEALGIFRRGFLFERNAFSTAYKNFDGEHFAALMPAVLWTFLNRVATMVRERNPGASALREDPYAELSRPGARRTERLARWLGVRREETAEISDPLTVAQLRALLSIADRMGSLARQRREVQARRARPDAEIFRRFPLRIVPTYPGDEALFREDFFRALLPEGIVLAERALSDIFRGQP